MTFERTVRGLAEGILAVRPLARILPQPVHVVPVLDGKLAADANDPPRTAVVGSLDMLFDRLSARFGTRSLQLCPRSSGELTVFEHAISNRLGVTPELYCSFAMSGDILAGLDAIIAEVAEQSLACLLPYSAVKSFDGATLSAYAGGHPSREVIVVVPPCGYPVELCERWFRHLMGRYRVLTWESRGLFPAMSEFDSIAHDTEAHARDLLAVMDHFGVASAHAMGLCGGAVVVLVAAALQPHRLPSLSLWHGDYELGPSCLKTTHQRHLQELLSMAGASRDRAALLGPMFTGLSTLANLRRDLAPLMLYPYATPELFYRYATLNGRIMTTNAEGWLQRVRQPTLVVTSAEDTTAHPDGSRHVASRLPNAQLYVRPRGVHLSLFDADTTLTDLTVQFIRDHMGPPHVDGR